MKAQIQSTAKRIKSALLITVCAHVILFLGVTYSVSAQTSLLVEGNCGDPAATSTAPGTCGDYDGDGRIGGAENNDGDKVFGSIYEAANVVNFDPNGGIVSVVTSGNFTGQINISGRRGTVTLQAAPGVQAIVDNSLLLPGSDTNLEFPLGVSIGSSSERYVVLRNLTFRYCSFSAISVFGDARAAIEGCHLENNDDVGISVSGNARVTISHTKVFASNNGQSAVNAATGAGILFSNNSSGSIFQTTVSGTRGVGIANRTGRADAVCAYLVNVFDNTTNYQGVIPTSDPCGFSSKGRTFSRY
ncbi:MAG: right-handed parallel beta-helix repeat-containing protein [Pyrinomonadaceae bacterium MAG19_C2-C3]|nr:right-handed parallel beta-helix repeat-containing protein [Pyrinomonadaceae bacterium MAG19_C2-C3]